FSINRPPRTVIYTLSLHDALPISVGLTQQQQRHADQRCGMPQLVLHPGLEYREHPLRQLPAQGMGTEGAQRHTGETTERRQQQQQPGHQNPPPDVYTTAILHHPGQPPDRPAVKTILRKIAKWILILLLLSLLPVILFRWVPVPGSMLMVERWLEARGDDQPIAFQQQWIGYRAIPDNIKMAVIAAEDQRFAEHYGFDVDAILAAVEHNQRGGHLRGASTLS